MPKLTHTTLQISKEDMDVLQVYKQHWHLKKNTHAFRHMLDTITAFGKELNTARDEIAFLKKENERTMRILESITGGHPTAGRAATADSSKYRVRPHSAAKKSDNGSSPIWTSDSPIDAFSGHFCAFNEASKGVLFA